MTQSADTVALKELSLLDDEASLSLLKQVIVDETCLTDMIQQQQLKLVKHSTTNDFHEYGIFNKIGNLPLMVYKSAYQGISSGIKFISGNIHYTKTDVELMSCTHSSHPFLYPFFKANVKVNKLLQLWMQNNTTSPLFESVN